MEANFTVAEVIELMKRTRKTDALFKPLKKLKTAIEGIGETALSFSPTSRVAAFHFGLGNDLDRQFLALTHPQGLASPITIIPGRSYTLLHFTTPAAAEQYMLSMANIEGRPMAYAELQYQNLNRTLIFLYCRQDLKSQTEAVAIANCAEGYTSVIDGLQMVEEVISREEEAALLRWLDGGEWEKLNNRRVQHFGYRFKYGRNQVDKDELEGLLPPFLHPLLAALTKIPILQNAIFDQLTVNDYFAGDGIPAHFDTHSPFEEPFISVSLLSGLVMDFRRFDGQERSVHLPARSVAIFSGEARYAWTHGIACRKIDVVEGGVRQRSRRVSLTFRKIRWTPCQCPYFFYCDSQGYDQATMKKHNPLLVKYLAKQHAQQLAVLTPARIEQEYVHAAYNGFGFDFHNKVIPEVAAYLQKDLREGELVVDLGCGNGEYKKHVRNDVFYLGVERCRTMAAVQDAFHMDCLRLCLRSGMFDRVLLIAVLHHMACRETRLQVLREAARVMAGDGRLYLTVLSYQHKREVYSSPETLLEYCLPASKVPLRQQQSQEARQKGRMQARGEVYSRYYHLFTVEELTALMEEAGLQVAQIVTAGENIIAKASKKQ